MNKSILITDDEQAIRETLALFLAEEGFVCHLAKDGREAVEQARRHSLDVVLMDLHMPRPNGIEVLREIREYQPDAAVLILTSYCHIDEAAQALNEGATKLLLKPIDFDELLDIIKQQVSMKN